MKAPCKDCKNRQSKCHSKCAKYQEYHQQQKEINKNKALENDINYNPFIRGGQH